MPRKKVTPVVLEPQGVLDISKARQVRDDLNAAFAEGTQVVVKLEGVTEADLTFFQLLCAAHREAAVQGKKLTVDNTGIQEPLQRLLLEGGIARQFECQHAKGQQCLWCGEGW